MNSSITIKQIVWILGFALILLALEQLFRPLLWGSIIVFGILSIVLLPWWIAREKHSFFGWLKLYSVVLSVAWFAIVRYFGLDQEWAYFIVYLTLAFNIFEAVLFDIFKGRKRFEYYINAAIGLALILTLPGREAIEVVDVQQSPELFWHVSLLWITCYTVWNLTFVHMQTPQHTGMHVAVLAAPVMAIFLGGSELWVIARAYTLGLFLMMFFTYKPAFDTLRLPKVVNWPIARFGLLLGAVLAAATIFLT